VADEDPHPAPAGRVNLPVLDCNRCGECCRQGGSCGLRGESWTLRTMPLEFVGPCDLLTSDGDCSVMRRVIEQDGSDDALRRFMGVVGECDFPALRKVKY
jgi:hypothetical protein